MDDRALASSPDSLADSLPEHTMSTSSFTSAITRVALLLAVVAAPAVAQDTTAHPAVDRGPSELARRSAGSLTVIQSRPQGAFGQNVGLGYGLDGAYLLRLDDAGIWSLRLSAGIVRYGDESRRTALSESVGGRVLVDVKTDNYVAPMSIGPQLTWPSGSFRPYVNAGVGGQAFFTESHLEGTADRSAFASTTNHSSFAASWTLGGGVYMPIYAGKTNVQLDLGMQYVNGGRTRYLAPGSITDLPGAQIVVTPLESATHLVILRLGARVGL
jgi:opacity protein-like surface antigen